jgi:hypothetical protein
MSTVPDPRFCRCCETPSARTPLAVWNRPGLSALAYRVGTFASFREAMLEDIVRQSELAGLSTRESDDYAITLIELFAAVGDVLTFYNERIANELYLRTARERDSVLRLVRLIGYRLRPGLAANAMLDFTLDKDARTRIRKGLKVMSVPGQDERPQTFETLEEIQADARLNALPVHAPPLPFNAFAQGRSEAPILSRPDPLSQGDRLLVFGGSTIEEKTVVTLEQASDGERLRFAPGVQASGLWPGVARVARLVRRLRFFGHNAPTKHPHYDPDPTIPPQNRWKSLSVQADFGASTTSYPLDARYQDLKPGAQLLVDAGPGEVPRLRTAVVTETGDGPAQLTGKESPAATAVSIPGLEDTVTQVTLTQTIQGRPSAAIAIGGSRALVARSGAGFVMGINPDMASGQWQLPWDELVASGDPAIVRAGPARWDVLVRDRFGRLRQMTFGAGGWGSWQDRGGVLTSQPVPITLPSGRLLVLARGLEGGLWVRELAPGLGSWQFLDGLLTSDPAAVSWGGGRIDVFVRGPNRALWCKVYDAGAWSDWGALGGILAGAPAAVSTAPHRLDLVALGDDGGLIHRRWTGTAWTDWLSLGGKVMGEPAAVATGPDRVDVLVRGADSQLWQIARTGSNWGAWIPLGGSLASSPTVVVDSATLHVYARGTQGALIARSWTAAGWGPWRTLGEGIGTLSDRRTTRLFEIAMPEIETRGYDYPETITGGRVAARLADAPGLKGLDKGRRILLDDGTAQHLAEVTATKQTASTPGEIPDHLFIDFTPPVPEPYAASKLHGNIAKASHGETQPEEPLGNGDATRAFPKFRLHRSPLTYVQSATRIAGAAELEVRINGELWREVDSLYNRKPVERVYTARQNDVGETEIRFGDGRTGARVPSGAMNLVARYRTGLGLQGRMKADQLSILLERPVGLRSVTNPLPADGGADAETRDDARGAAPGTVRTFGRAVSLRDFEALATSSGLVARAHATWVWQRLEKTVHLTVAAAGGAALSSDSLQTLHEALTASRDPNRPLLLANLVRVPVVVRAKLLREAAFEADSLLAAARAALIAHFDFATMPLARAVHASDIYAVLQGAKGVLAVDLDLFHLKGYAGLTAAERAVRAVTADAVQGQIRIFPASPTPADVSLIDRFARAGFAGPTPPPVLAAEQAYIQDPAADIDLSIVEAF